VSTLTDTLIYLATAILTILWSAWIYLGWMEKAGLPESSPRRFLLMLSPSAYFLLMAMAGWERSAFLRLDLLGLLALDGLTLSCWLALLLARGLRAAGHRRSYASLIGFYNALAVLLVLLAHLVRAFPPLLIGLANLVRQLRRIDLFAFAWVGLDPETHRDNLPSLLNKLLIALLSYIPISILRSLVQARQRRRMQQEIDRLRRRLDEIERDRSVMRIESEEAGGIEVSLLGEG
jgi:hypothetical protein